MTDPVIQSSADVAPSLSQGQRVIDTFTAPSKTFEDIKRGNRSWWLPFIITAVFTWIFFAAITTKVGWPTVADNVIRMNPKAAERMSQLTPEQKDMQMKATRWGMEGFFAASPVVGLLFVCVGSLVFLGTINFGFGGKATFGSVFAVWMYAFLPWLIKSIFGTIVLFVGLAPESFNLNNPAPTSIGSFLPTDMNLALYTFASWLDFTTIWCLVLMSIGLATVARTKRSSGYIVVFGWWALCLIVSVGYAAVTS